MERNIVASLIPLTVAVRCIGLTISGFTTVKTTNVVNKCVLFRSYNIVLYNIRDNATIHC